MSAFDARPVEVPAHRPSPVVAIGSLTTISVYLNPGSDYSLTMTTTAKSDGADVALEGPFGARQLRSLKSRGRIEDLSLTKHPLITAKVAKGFSALLSVRRLYLGCPITRTAMRYVISIPGLEFLHLRDIRAPGMLENFEEATEINTFLCGFLSDQDFLAIARLPNLEELGAQNATLSASALEAILRIPKLRKLDLEASELDDNMATAVASSSTIESLDIGATQVTAVGLRSICMMSQLRHLDIWALDIQEEDLELLARLPNLEYLSLGHRESQTTLTSNGVLPRLAQLPSLKRIWLDGIALSRSERAALEKRYEFVRN